MIYHEGVSEHMMESSRAFGPFSLLLDNQYNLGVGDCRIYLIMSGFRTEGA